MSRCDKHARLMIDKIILVFTAQGSSAGKGRRCLGEVSKTFTDPRELSSSLWMRSSLYRIHTAVYRTVRLLWMSSNKPSRSCVSARTLMLSLLASRPSLVACSRLLISTVGPASGDAGARETLTADSRYLTLCGVASLNHSSNMSAIKARCLLIP